MIIYKAQYGYNLKMMRLQRIIPRKLSIYGLYVCER